MPTSISSKERQRLIEDLTHQIEQHSDAKTKQWFDNYLKGAITYRGAKTPLVTKIVKEWHHRHQLTQYSPKAQLSLCTHLIASPLAEDKFAGAIYIQKFLLSKLSYAELLKTCDSLFQKGYFFDWSTTDWFCTRVLDPTIIKQGLEAAIIIANGRFSNNLWQRRASIVSFRHASSHVQYHPLIEQIIADLLPSNERFIQTGIGWVLADMSKSYPKKAEALFRQYIYQLSKEVIDRHTKHLDCQPTLKQLKRRSL
ncbi:MAG: DNA alkylation repair protein [Cyanobacteria bacterium P01_D01_bin.105]